MKFVTITISIFFLKETAYPGLFLAFYICGLTISALCMNHFSFHPRKFKKILQVLYWWQTLWNIHYGGAEKRVCGLYFVGGILVHICFCFPQDMKSCFKERLAEEFYYQTVMMSWWVSRKMLTRNWNRGMWVKTARKVVKHPDDKIKWYLQICVLITMLLHSKTS